MRYTSLASPGAVALALVASSMMAGCSIQEVKPWQRGTLAQAEMGWDPDPMLASYRRHVEFSKEAATGGATLGGGGCGCSN